MNSVFSNYNSIIEDSIPINDSLYNYKPLLTRLRNSSCHFRFDKLPDENKIKLFDEDNSGNRVFEMDFDINYLVDITRQVQLLIQNYNNQQIASHTI